MLPVTAHKSFHIPHTLATLAAIVALITAMGWETSGDDIADLRASSARETRTEAAQAPAQQESRKAKRSVRVDTSADISADTSADTSNCERTCDRHSLYELLPLVLPGPSRP